MYLDHRDLHSFPTRRSSDLSVPAGPVIGSGDYPAVDDTNPNDPSYDGVGRDGTFSFDSASSDVVRSEEHTSELQSQFHLVCRLLLEKKKTTEAFMLVLSCDF